MDITHKTTGRTVWVVVETNEDGDMYTFVFKDEAAADKWIENATTNWLNSEENQDIVKPWLENNPNWSIENDAYFIFEECSGVSYEKNHSVEWELA